MIYYRDALFQNLTKIRQELLKHMADSDVIKVRYFLNQLQFFPSTFCSWSSATVSWSVRVTKKRCYFTDRVLRSTVSFRRTTAIKSELIQTIIFIYRSRHYELSERNQKLTGWYTKSGVSISLRRVLKLGIIQISWLKYT